MQDANATSAYLMKEYYSTIFITVILWKATKIIATSN